MSSFNLNKILVDMTFGIVNNLSIETQQRVVMTAFNDIAIAKKYINKAKNSAKRGIEFSLTFAEYKRLINRKTCYYTGVKFNNTLHHPDSKTIDRVDNKKGYINGNVVVCTYKINHAKALIMENTQDKERVNIEELTKMVNAINKFKEKNHD